MSEPPRRHAGRQPRRRPGELRAGRAPASAAAPAAPLFAAARRPTLAACTPYALPCTLVTHLPWQAAAGAAGPRPAVPCLLQHAARALSALHCTWRPPRSSPACIEHARCSLHASCCTRVPRSFVVWRAAPPPSGVAAAFGVRLTICCRSVAAAAGITAPRACAGGHRPRKHARTAALQPTRRGRQMVPRTRAPVSGGMVGVPRRAAPPPRARRARSRRAASAKQPRPPALCYPSCARARCCVLRVSAQGCGGCPCVEWGSSPVLQHCPVSGHLFCFARGALRRASRRDPPFCSERPPRARAPCRSPMVASRCARRACSAARASRG